MAGTVVRAQTVVIRCDASPAIGHGHLVRCLALADAMQSAHALRVVFCMIHDASSASTVEARGYEVHLGPAAQTAADQGEWLRRVVGDESATVLVLDVRDDLPVEAVRSLKAQGVLVATIDDPTERRLVSDLAFYPRVPQVLSMDWSNYAGELHVGWEWIIVRRDILAHRDDSPDQEPTHRSVLVTMGGSDPAGLTLRVLSVIETMPEDFDTTVVIGSGYVHKKALDRFLAVARRKYHVEHDVQNIGELMTQSRIAVTSFGGTAYELAVLGVPSITLSLTDDHAASASALEGAGGSVSLGLHSKVGDSQIAKAILSLLSKDEQRRRMRRKALATLDGRGAERIARTIARRVERTT